MVIRHIGVWSVARLYGALSAAMGLLFGAIFALIGIAGAGLAGASSSGSGFSGFGLGFGVGAIVAFPLFYGALGLIMGAIGAALYNVFAGMFGGIQLDTEP